eukprot:4287780-Pyramimonas_sp.AAC.1
MPGRGTRDAAAVAGEVIARHQREHRAKRRGSTSAPPPMLLAVLTDIEKAFDAVVRQDVWQSLEALELRWGARATLERLHEGMCYLFRDATTHVPVARIWVKQGVRQGGSESPGLFVAVYDGIVYRITGQLQKLECPAIKVHYDPTLKRIRCNGSLE